MAKTLFRGEVSPVVRFGIRQYSDGTLHAASPCCNRGMKDFQAARCKKCGREWWSERPGASNITSAVLVRAGTDGGYRLIRDWARTLTKHNSLELTVSR